MQQRKPRIEHPDCLVVASALVGTITGMLAVFKIIATSQHPPHLSDLTDPPLIALIITSLCICLSALIHAIITHINK